jgi:hypothetical protein
MSSSNATMVGMMPPPEGVTPNITNPDSIGYRMLIIAILFPILCAPILAARLWSAAFIIRRWHLDDCKFVLNHHKPHSSIPS